jgi:hypothetical protein
MRRTRIAVLLSLIILAIAAPTASAHGRSHGESWLDRLGFDIPGVLPAWLPVHRHNLVDFATDWETYAFGTADPNPLIDGRCEQSRIDHRVWYLPVSLGGDASVTCDVPRGAFLFQNVGSAECSNQEQGTIWYGADVPALQQCVKDDFELISKVELTIDGWTTTDLHRHVATSRPLTLPAGNLISPNPALSMQKGYFVMFFPMRAGTHTIRGYDEFGSLGFAGGITYTINVH